MKKIITTIITTIILLSLNKSNATPPPIDTLLLLRTRIENNKTHFIGKPFKVLIDTLKNLKLPIIEYSGPADIVSTMYITDTIFIEGFNLYFEKFMYSKKETYHDNVFFASKGLDTINTHIKIIKIRFQAPIPYVRAWEYLSFADSDKYANLSGVLWNRKIANLYKDAIIKDLWVYEY